MGLHHCRLNLYILTAPVVSLYIKNDLHWSVLVGSRNGSKHY